MRKTKKTFTIEIKRKKKDRNKSSIVGTFGF